MTKTALIRRNNPIKIKMSHLEIALKIHLSRSPSHLLSVIMWFAISLTKYFYLKIEEFHSMSLSPRYKNYFKIKMVFSRLKIRIHISTTLSQVFRSKSKWAAKSNITIQLIPFSIGRIHFSSISTKTTSSLQDLQMHSLQTSRTCLTNTILKALTAKIKRI